MAKQTAKRSINNIDEEYAMAALVVEKELGVFLTPEYPALKFVEQLHQLGLYAKKEKQAQERAQANSRSGRSKTMR